MVHIGSMAPDFTLPSTGQRDDVTLSAYRGKKNVLLVFFPLAFTPGCIRELTTLKEDYHLLTQCETEVLGVSVDHIYSQNVFESTLGTLPYPLVSDWHKEMVKAYGVLDDSEGVAIRSVFLLDKEGILVYKNEAFDPGELDHYEEVYKQCSRLD